MKRNIALGILFIGAVALSSCSTTKLASSQDNDDVYFSKAKAADEPVYAAQPQYSQQEVQEVDDDSDDYFYYDDYASRINRFSYYSPFSYYDDLYYGYGNYAYNNGFSLGFNYGPYGYGYSPYGYGGWGLGYGFGGWGLGYGFGGLGLGYGYGGYYGGGFGYGGYYGGRYGGYYGGGYASSGTPRPVRGTGSPYRGNGVRSSSSSLLNSNGIGYIPGGRNNNVRPGGGTPRNSSSVARETRPTQQSDNRPVMQSVDRSPSPAPVSSSPSSSGGSRSGGGGGGGGGRPVRP